MSLANRQDGMIHMILANEDDYYQPNLIKMNLDQYIYYRLKRERCDDVMFLRYEKAGYTFVIRQYGREDRIVDTNIILQEIQSDRKIAIVLNVDVMDRLLHYEDFCKELVETNKTRCNSKLLLKLSYDADHSFYSLIRFAKQMPELFGSVASVLEKSTKTLFYRQLDIEMGNRFCVAHSVTRDRIKFMCHRMVLDQTFYGSKDSLNDYVSLFCSLFYSQEVRQKLFGSSRQREEIDSVRKLSRLLSEPKSWESVNSIVQNDREFIVRIQKQNSETAIHQVTYPRFSPNSYLDELKRSLERETYENEIDFRDLLQMVEELIDTCRNCWSNSAQLGSFKNEIGQCLQFIDEYRDIYKNHSELLDYNPVSVLIFKMQYEVDATLNNHISGLNVFSKTMEAILNTAISVMENQRQYDRQHKEMVVDTQKYQKGLLKLQELQQKKERKEKDYLSKFGEAAAELFKYLEFDLLRKLQNAKKDLKAFEETLYVKDAINQRLHDEIIQSKKAIDHAYVCIANLQKEDSTGMSDVLSELEGLMTNQLESTNTQKESLKKLHDSLHLL